MASWSVTSENSARLGNWLGWEYDKNRLVTSWDYDNVDTPCLIVDKERLERNVQSWKRMERKDSRLKTFYAVKANYLPVVLDTVAGNGMGVEIMSDFELQMAVGAGIHPSDIVFNGPGKSIAEIQTAFEQGIQINADSTEELELIWELARQRGETADVILRIHPLLGKEIERRCFIHRNSKLGVDPDRALSFLKKEKQRLDTHLNVVGVHCHVGTAQTSTDLLGHVLEFMSKFSDDLSSKAGITLNCWNLGGGFESPLMTQHMCSAPDELEGKEKETNASAVFSCDEELPAFASLQEDILGLVSNHDIERIQFEPGRSIVGDAVSLLSSVRMVKKSFGTTWVILDAGVNILIPLRYSAFLPLPCLLRDGDFEGRFAGPICMPVDVISGIMRMPAHRGDMMVILNAGAYTQSMEEAFGSQLLPIYEAKGPELIQIDRWQGSAVENPEKQ